MSLYFQVNYKPVESVSSTCMGHCHAVHRWLIPDTRSFQDVAAKRTVE